MNRPRVNQIESQRVEGEREITGYEAEEILRKYGYSQNFSGKISEIDNGVNRSETFEEMVAREEKNQKIESEKLANKRFGPKPTTFDGSGGYNSEVKWDSDPDLGFGFKIEIVTDMNLPKY